MKIVIAGGSGFIGKELTGLLLEEGHEVVILTRHPKEGKENLSYVKWLHDDSNPAEHIKEADAFVNLAGVSINEGRWTEKQKQLVYDSRMEATEELLHIISKLVKKPSVLVNGSAVGIYPTSETRLYTEQSNAVADNLLGITVSAWEKKASQAEGMGIRPVYTRFGVVLGGKEGALPLMVLPYRLGAGGKIGSGRQWVSWIHVKDAVRAIYFAIQNENIHGPVNVTSPFPLRMNDFGKTIGRVLNRPHWMPAPSFMMKTVLGEKSMIILEGQQVRPDVLLESGFTFQYSTAEKALENLLTT